MPTKKSRQKTDNRALPPGCERSWLDEGPPGWVPGPHTSTRGDRCVLRPDQVRHVVDTIPGCSRESALFAESPTGRMDKRKWSAFKRSISARGVEFAPQIIKESDGHVCVNEGNHRLRAAAEVGVPVRVEFLYFANSQKSGLVYDPNTNELTIGRRK